MCVLSFSRYCPLASKGAAPVGIPARWESSVVSHLPQHLMFIDLVFHFRHLGECVLIYISWKVNDNFLRYALPVQVCSLLHVNTYVTLIHVTYNWMIFLLIDLSDIFVNCLLLFCLPFHPFRHILINVFLSLMKSNLLILCFGANNTDVLFENM